MAQSSEIATWWGRHRLPPDRTDLWTVGPLELMAEHLENMWRIHWRHIAVPNQTAGQSSGNFRLTGVSPDQIQTFLVGPAPRSAMSPYFPAKIQSVATPASNPNEDLIFSPILPEESLVLSLGSAAVLDPGEKITTGFLIPLTIRVETAAGQDSPREACEVPLFPLVRTWGGTNPLNGELAMTPDRTVRVERWSASKPRLDMAGISIRIINRGTDSVFVDRILVPCSRLSLFHSPQSGFWCDTLVLEANSDFGGITGFESTERVFPREAGAPTLVTHARQTPLESAAMKGLATFRSTIGTSVENLFKERG